MRIPLPDAYAQCVCIAFGVRNLVDIPQGLREMVRILKPGGKLLILDLGEPGSVPGSHWYLQKILPLIGRWSADPSAYTYLVQSLSQYPAPGELIGLGKKAGLREMEYHGHLGDLVRIHLGVH